MSWWMWTTILLVLAGIGLWYWWWDDRRRERMLFELMKRSPPVPQAAAATEPLARCKSCDREYPWASGGPTELSVTEQIICAKENLPFAQMKKITCPHCGSKSLAPDPRQ